ncbi:hypothetical protein [Streptomyces sp. TRM49041]|uniref:hypothetical protein n=1 Tax=Streptomyces sp. TRM49041 TaxID=2603216 RepID=UPI0011EE7FFB|nr:hypothetical protein [Streptomyces sp. TRM49041]
MDVMAMLIALLLPPLMLGVILAMACYEDLVLPALTVEPGEHGEPGEPVVPAEAEEDAEAVESAGEAEGDAPVTPLTAPAAPLPVTDQPVTPADAA